MKKYKYSLLSLMSYILAFLIIHFVFVSAPSSGPTPYYFSYLLLAGFFLIPVGIFFGFKSNNEKESLWSGKLLTLMGLLLLFPFLFYWGFGSTGDGAGIAGVILVVVTLSVIFSWIP